MEILTYSAEQLFISVDNSKKWEKGSKVTLIFYEGKQFTDRRFKSGKKTPWEDAEIVFEGDVEESRITYDEVDQYGLYCELRETLKSENYQEE